MDSQMKKGVVEMALLWMIGREETYGYDLLQRLSGRIPGMQERVIYAILRRLCDNGYTETFSGTVSEGPARKYYRLTPAGQARLRDLRESWEVMRRFVEELGM